MVEEYTACNRCGKEMKSVSKNPCHAIKYVFRHATQLNCETSETFSYVCNRKIEELTDKAKIESVVIVIHNRFKQRRIDLCGECRKEFERFMRKE